MAMLNNQRLIPTVPPPRTGTDLAQWLSDIVIQESRGRLCQESIRLTPLERSIDWGFV